MKRRGPRRLASLWGPAGKALPVRKALMRFALWRLCNCARATAAARAAENGSDDDDDDDYEL